MRQNIKIALAGNPNSGKTSLFNTLTGLNQKVGNFPGVTVDKKIGECNLDTQHKALIIDIPGVYGLYPRSEDEYVAHSVIVQPQHENNPEVFVVLVDATSLKRNLLLATQIIDLQKPTIIALSMVDLADQKGIKIDTKALSLQLDVPVVTINPRNNEGIDALKSAIVKVYQNQQIPKPVNTTAYLNVESSHTIAKHTQINVPYTQLHLALYADRSTLMDDATKIVLQNILTAEGKTITTIQAADITARYKKIDQVLQQSVDSSSKNAKAGTTYKWDKILLHPVLGYVLMFVIMLVVFQALFALASYPMDWIDGMMSGLQDWATGALPSTWWADLITNGIIAGLGGVIIFVPQIAILFFLITILEETGYMSRISFLTDKIMQKVGMNGRSVMPLVSGMACAIPAVMAARTITNPKERLLTILVTPLMSCSARLPVYTLLIAMIVPDEMVLGVFNMQGLVMMGMYVLGILMSLIVSYVLNKVIKSDAKSIYMMELPMYRWPRWKNAFITMYEKAKIFVLDAGKIIIILSIVLWFMSNYGPTGRFDGIEDKYAQIENAQTEGLTTKQEEDKANELLANSYAGILGHAIEPVIKPLGYDWKIGIALISSFAAREVFVGTMATLYSVGEEVEEDDLPLREKMQQATDDQGNKIYTTATGVSLLMFYAFAMQCISTIAIVRRETNSWKWTIIQVVLYTAIAYVTAFAAYNIFQ